MSLNKVELSLGDTVYLSISRKADSEQLLKATEFLKNAGIKIVKWEGDYPSEKSFRSVLFVPPAGFNGQLSVTVGRGQFDEFMLYCSAKATTGKPAGIFLFKDNKYYIHQIGMVAKTEISYQEYGVFHNIGFITYTEKDLVKKEVTNVINKQSTSEVKSSNRKMLLLLE